MDEKADVYAFGGVLVELFGEKPLWPPLSSYQLMYKVGVEGSFPAYDHLPASIQALCAMCLVDRLQRAPMLHVLKKLIELARP